MSIAPPRLTVLQFQGLKIRPSEVLYCTNFPDDKVVVGRVSFGSHLQPGSLRRSSRNSQARVQHCSSSQQHTDRASGGGRHRKRQMRPGHYFQTSGDRADWYQAQCHQEQQCCLSESGNEWRKNKHRRQEKKTSNKATHAEIQGYYMKLLHLCNKLWGCF